MSKQWEIDKNTCKKCSNQYYLNLLKILIFFLPVSLFFILVGILDDPGAFDYGIPYTLIVGMFLCFIGIGYLMARLKIKKVTKNISFTIHFDENKSIKYTINDSVEFNLNYYKLTTLKNFLIITDLSTKNYLLIPKKETEDISELIDEVKKKSSKTLFVFNYQGILYILTVIIFFILIFITSSRTTTKYIKVDALEEAQNIELVQECYPKDSIQNYPYIQTDFYYFNEAFRFVPDRKPEICLVGLEYSEADYKNALERLTIPTEYYYKTNEYVFYLTGDRELFPKRFSMIVLNENKNTIIFIGFNDKTNHYQKMIEKDFMKFINKVYGEYYDFN